MGVVAARGFPAPVAGRRAEPVRRPDQPARGAVAGGDHAARHGVPAVRAADAGDARVPAAGVAGRRVDGPHAQAAGAGGGRPRAGGRVRLGAGRGGVRRAHDAAAVRGGGGGRGAVGVLRGGAPDVPAEPGRALAAGGGQRAVAGQRLGGGGVRAGPVGVAGAAVRRGDGGRCERGELPVVRGLAAADPRAGPGAAGAGAGAAAARDRRRAPVRLPAPGATRDRSPRRVRQRLPAVPDHGGGAVPAARGAPVAGRDRAAAGERCSARPWRAGSAGGSARRG